MRANKDPIPNSGAVINKENCRQEILIRLKHTNPPRTTKDQGSNCNDNRLVTNNMIQDHTNLLVAHRPGTHQRYKLTPENNVTYGPQYPSVVLQPKNQYDSPQTAKKYAPTL